LTDPAKLYAVTQSYAVVKEQTVPKEQQGGGLAPNLKT